MGKLQWRLRCCIDHWILIYNLKQLIIQSRSRPCYKYTFCRVNDSFQHIVWQSEPFTFTLRKPVIGSAANCSVFKSDVAVQHSPKRVGSAAPYNLCPFFFLISLHTASCYLLLAAINLSPDSGTSKSGAVVTSLSPPSLWPGPKGPSNPPQRWYSAHSPLRLPPLLCFVSSSWLYHRLKSKSFTNVLSITSSQNISWVARFVNNTGVYPHPAWHLFCLLIEFLIYQEDPSSGLLTSGKC